MMFETKYIITKQNQIIIFSNTIQHSDFRHFNPIRAGFISFGVNKDGNPSCSCYGQSISLGLSSRPEEDTEIAMRHLNFTDCW
jgi:hypothetical protein